MARARALLVPSVQLDDVLVAARKHGEIDEWERRKRLDAPRQRRGARQRRNGRIIQERLPGVPAERVSWIGRSHRNHDTCLNT